MVCQLPFISVPFMHFGIRAAWKELENLPSDEAKLQYIGLVKSACPDFQEAQAGKVKGWRPGRPCLQLPSRWPRRLTDRTGEHFQ